MSNNRLVVEGLSYERNDNLLFDGLSFSVNSGELLHICGSNGCGKTTLLRLICGLTKPCSGRILWSNQAITPDHPTFYHDLIYLGHKDQIRLNLTVEENIRLMNPHLISNSVIQSALNSLNFNQYRAHMANTLSMGQKKKVALSRLRVGHSQLWLLDEPFSHLDSKTTFLLSTWIKEQQNRGGVVILTSHQPIDGLFSDYKELTLS